MSLGDGGDGSASTVDTRDPDAVVAQVVDLDLSPFADIHVHSDCSHSARSIFNRAQEFDIPAFQGMNLAQVEQAIHPPAGADWPTWYKHLQKVRQAYTSPQVIGALFEDLMADAQAAGVDLLELRVSLLSTTMDMLKNKGVTAPALKDFWRAAHEIWEEILKAREKMNKSLNTQTDLVMSVSCQQKFRDFVADLMTLCLENKGEIVGIDLTNEKETDPNYYVDQIFRVRGDIKGLTIHCMEVTGPDRGWSALTLNPDRIGHGVNVVQNRRLMETFADRAIPVEVCLQSNVVTGVLARPEDHPLRQMMAMGIPIVIGSDGANDGTTLRDNYMLLQKTFGLSDEQLRRFKWDSFDAAFRNKYPR